MIFTVMLFRSVTMSFTYWWSFLCTYLEIGNIVFLGKMIWCLFCQINKELMKSLTYLNTKYFVCTHFDFTSFLSDFYHTSVCYSKKSGRRLSKQFLCAMWKKCRQMRIQLANVSIQVNILLKITLDCWQQSTAELLTF